MENPIKIAIVDDYESVQWSLALVLKKGLYIKSIQTFGSCEVLLNYLNNGVRFDIYIIDWQLNSNGKRGDKVAEQVFKFHPDAKIIGISVECIASDIFRQAGVNTFLAKPFSPEILLDTVNSILKGAFVF